jgi:hypothetical protein
VKELAHGELLDLGNDYALKNDGGDLWLNFDGGEGMGLILSCRSTHAARMAEARDILAEALRRIDEHFRGGGQ